jgi:transcription elongation factor S-II
MKKSEIFGFFTEQSENIPYSLIKYSNRNLDRISVYIEIGKTITNYKLATYIESGIYEFSLLYTINNNYHENFLNSIYNNKYDEVLDALKRNPELLKDITDNRIKPEYVAFMTPSELCPNNWKKLLDKKHLKEEKENYLPTTDLYKCRRCGKRKCTVSLLQTRSIDEPMTTFVKCCNCYSMWTIS